jgi:ABC-type multidrug transport system permease subunit
VQLSCDANPATPPAWAWSTILDEFLSQVEVGRVGGQVAVEQLIHGGLVQPGDAAQLGAAIGRQSALASGNSPSIAIHAVTNRGEAIPFDILAYIAPGMALMFLMYTTSYGGRVLLAERSQGTLPRLLVSPTTSAQVLGGKVFGTFLTGAAQMFILILASTLLFGLQWGDPLGILALVLAAVFGATGWGLLVTAIARTPGQASWIGTAIMLIFGLLGGSFISLENMPGWFRLVSRITPNAWGLDGFSTLAMGGALGDILPALLALLGMGALLSWLRCCCSSATTSCRIDSSYELHRIDHEKSFCYCLKDTLLRFSGLPEWIFFLVLPIVFTRHPGRRHRRSIRQAGAPGRGGSVGLSFGRANDRRAAGFCRASELLLRPGGEPIYPAPGLRRTGHPSRV